MKLQDNSWPASHVPALLGAAAFAGTAQAQDKIFVPLFTYRTGPSPTPASRSPTACTTI